MKVDTLNAIGEAKESLICLRYTKTLDSEALREPKWIECNALYGQCSNPIQRAVVSIYNALQYHNRQVICMTRDLTMALVRNDPNHSERGIRNDKWSEILSALFHANIVKVLRQEKSKPWIMEVIDPDLLKSMKQQSYEEQLTECVMFIDRQKNLAGDGLGDGLGDGVRRRSRSTRTENSVAPTADAGAPLIQFQEASLPLPSEKERSKTPGDDAPRKETKDEAIKRRAEERRRKNPYW